MRIKSQPKIGEEDSYSHFGRNESKKSEPYRKESGHQSSKQPYTSLDEFKAFEKEIQEHHSKFNSLVAELSLVFSQSAEKYVKAAWRKILPDEAAQHLSWKGTETKMLIFEKVST
ncbi:PREDICTED: uncharacterized protein LOC108360458 isoform X2 [Rhagoletis zephyria]|uniref:uncharacterized protein LOC108360458 isoform X2 n=1 Tax=Rhagoletis zephyria TaxID=28612 RepID=UPI0008112609|nr:PREDICTED: uncharacterized protein LOC108360458 isoform X2 [Rhagoletis zephyria]